jgi:phosphopantothenoylcysteine decarboxylase/phosphopantothenate--cysteine ligase
MPFLVTCGGTRNPIDAMRFISARSTGVTGLQIARGLRALGLEPFVLGSAEARLRGDEVPGEEFGSTRDLMARMERWVRAHADGGLVHAAAVGDYEVVDPSAGKIGSGLATWTLTLTPTPKIADHVRAWGLVGPYVTFKAAAPGTSEAELVALATAQRSRTGCDLVFANALDRLGSGVLLVGSDVRRFERREEAIAALVGWIAA